MTLPKPPAPHNPECRYVRVKGDKWEYGIVEREIFGGSPKHKAAGLSDTYDQACMNNRMAISGEANLPDRGYSCSGRY